MTLKKIFTTSLYKFSDYPLLLLVKKSKTFLYIILLAFIMLIGYAFMLVPPLVQAGGIANVANEVVPEFEIKDGKLSCEKYHYVDEKSGVYIDVDTSKEGQPEVPSGYSQVLLVTKTHMISSDGGGIRGNSFENVMAELSLSYMDKSQLVQFLKDKEPIIYIAGSLLSLLLFFFRIILTALQAAIFAVVANVLILHAPLRFGQVFKLAIFSMTFAVVLSTVFRILSLRSIVYIESYITMILTLFYLIKGMITYKSTREIIIEELPIE